MSETGEKASGAVFCRGESMQPLLRPGDRIVFVPCRVEELKRGDVIIFMPTGAKRASCPSCHLDGACRYPDTGEMQIHAGIQAI